MNRLHLIAPALMVALLAGCSSTPTNPDQSGTKAPVSDGTTTTGTGTGTGNKLPTVTTGTTTGSGALRPWEDPKSELYKRSFYFDYDSYVVRDDDKPMAQKHAKFLLGSGNVSVVVQGNTDERGSREYNLALGQKRAEAVKKILNLQGVPESQVEAVSFGAEKPKALGHDEAAWAENRRADLEYKAK